MAVFWNVVQGVCGTCIMVTAAGLTIGLVCALIKDFKES